MSPRTRRNLNTALQGEAFSHATCLRFAAHARVNGNNDLAKLFQNTADVDRCEHFEKQFEMADLLHSELENLRAVIDAVSARIELYSRFQQEAASDGDLDLSSLFGRIGRDEQRQLQSLTSAEQKFRECSVSSLAS